MVVWWGSREGEVGKEGEGGVAGFAPRWWERSGVARW